MVCPGGTLLKKCSGELWPVSIPFPPAFCVFKDKLKTMTKAELVEEVARATELTKKDSEVIVEEVFSNIIQALRREEKIELRGFGSFRVRQREARRGRNPKTGAPVDIPAKRVVYFKPGKELKEMIGEKSAEEAPNEPGASIPVEQ
jgi:integration host factor subunit beta